MLPPCTRFSQFLDLVPKGRAECAPNLVRHSKMNYADNDSGEEAIWAPSQVPQRRLGAVAIGAIALGALAMGCLAFAVVAIGRLAIGSLVMGRADLRELRVGRLAVEQVNLNRVRPG
jgi:hypothetical protein